LVATEILLVQEILQTKEVIIILEEEIQILQLQPEITNHVQMNLVEQNQEEVNHAPTNRLDPMTRLDHLDHPEVDMAAAEDRVAVEDNYKLHLDIL
jgi:hypothetical protein